MALIFLILITTLIGVITWDGSDHEEEENEVMVYDVFPDVKEQFPKIKVEGLTPLTCKCCGGAIDRETLTCKYCETEYMV